jgi:hypothetical protein
MELLSILYEELGGRWEMIHEKTLSIKYCDTVYLNARIKLEVSRISAADSRGLLQGSGSCLSSTTFKGKLLTEQQGWIPMRSHTINLK